MPIADDQRTPEGFRVLDALAFTEDLVPTEIRWNAEQVQGPVSPATIEVTVQRTAAAAEYVTSEQVGTQDIALGCGAVLDIPVEVTLETSDGRLSEAFATSLAVDPSSPQTVELYLDLALGGVNGSLIVAQDDATGKLSISFAGDGRTSGAIDAQIVERSGSSVSERLINVATW